VVVFSSSDLPQSQARSQYRSTRVALSIGTNTPRRLIEEVDQDNSSTVARRLFTLASFYRYCEREQPIERNPALNVHDPRWTASRALWGWIATNWAP
jgi:site-specific recombinase XerD